MDFDAIASTLGTRPSGSPQPVGGGCIHRCYRWGSWFLKTNDRSQLANFRAEATGLQSLGETKVIRVPEVIAAGTTDAHAYLILEHLDLVGSGDETRLGEQLAALHHIAAEAYGFPEDNFIGATPQCNAWCDDWADFFSTRRLAPLFRGLASRGVTFAQGDRLLSRLPELLPRTPRASLLHGDLWGGNKAYLPDGTPVLFDPASHYGHAACDLAMTRLFGGFGRSFYEAYRIHSGLDEPDTHDLYRLYHLLNHALLFGGSYAADARTVIDRYV